nr:hypothetical protein [Kibdelosporangium sp. MJ126-NF4]CEL19819.1 hypothetical protein [Kibdelosporangium sp. MJ126-NF4]CTQ97044.1 hypothetical protein [Kibdelosporangium sp. MJ126-NF4]
MGREWARSESAEVEATAKVGPASPAVPLLHLQRLAGNGAVSRLVVQRYEAWEHRDLGDAEGGDQRKITLPNGITLSYGEVVALSGDFYRSPEALMRSSASELNQVRAVMDRERKQAAASPDHRPKDDDANKNNADYEMATTGHDRVAFNLPALGGDANAATGAHGQVTDGEHVESGAPSIQAGFLDLAASNAAHFSPENIRLNWAPKHQLALDLARQAWSQRHPGQEAAPIRGGEAASARAGTAPADGGGAAAVPATDAGAHAAAPGRADPAATPTRAGVAGTDTALNGVSSAEALEGQAWLSSAFSDHYLTDAFASGHLISGLDGRVLAEAFYSANATQIANACWSCAIADGMPPQYAQPVIQAFELFLAPKAASLLLKTAHDFYNEHGINVRNALGQEWTTFGDARLGGHAETIALAELASKASRDAVQDVLDTGTTARGSAALDYIPDLARLSGGGWKPIATFSTDRAVWDPVLALALSRDPATNRLYQLVKGNILPMGSMIIDKAGRGIGDAAADAYRSVTEIPERAGRWFDDLEREILRQYGVPR